MTVPMPPQPPLVDARNAEMASAWNLNLITLSAPEPAPGLWQQDLKACCGRHKVGPLFGALERYDTWFTGLRREQSPSRAGLEQIGSFSTAGSTITIGRRG